MGMYIFHPKKELESSSPSPDVLGGVGKARSLQKSLEEGQDVTPGSHILCQSLSHWPLKNRNPFCLLLLVTKF